MTRKERDRESRIRARQSLALRWLAASVIVGLTGFGLLIGAWWDARKAERTAQWPGVPGVVVHSRVGERQHHSGGGNPARKYFADVSYNYQVNGETHTGDEVAAGLGWALRGAAEALASKYPAGASVTVYHNPEDPSEAVLERGVTGANWSGLAVGAVMSFASLLCLAAFWGLRRSSRPAGSPPSS